MMYRPLVATIPAAYATADRNTGAWDAHDASTDHSDANIDNASFLLQPTNDNSPAIGGTLTVNSRSAMVFTSTGQAFRVGDETYGSDDGLSANCKDGATVQLNNEELKRRKSLTRLQQEVDFWVPKSMAQALTGQVWSDADGGQKLTCIVYAASAVARFQWRETKGGDMIPHIRDTTTIAEAVSATRLMCGANDDSTAVPTKLVDAEFHLPTKVLSNESDFDMPTFTLDQVNIKTRAGCSGTYEVFGFSEGLCVVTSYDSTTQALGGALFCITTEDAGDKFFVYTISAVNKTDAYFPFRDLDFFADGKTRGQRDQTIQSADGAIEDVCRVTANHAASVANRTTVSSKGRTWDPNAINNGYNPDGAPTYGDWLYTVSKTSMHELSQNVECIKVTLADGFKTLAGQSGLLENEDLGKGNDGTLVVDGHNAFSDHIEQEGSNFEAGSSTCNITQISVLNRGGLAAQEKMVVYGLCHDGTLICIGGGEDGMEDAVSSGCMGDDTIVEPGTFRGNTYRLNVNGYFMEPDQNAHKQDSTGTPKKFTGYDPAGLGGDKIMYSSMVTGTSDKFEDPGERTNELYDGTQYDITANMTGAERAVCIKASDKVLAIQTASGRLLVNSAKLAFPYKYGIVFVTQPLRTKDMNKEWRQGAAPKVGGAALDGVGSGPDGRATTGAHGGLPYGDDWLPTEQGYDSLRDGMVKEGDFVQVMLSDMPNTDMPNQVRSFTMGSDQTADTDNVWLSANMGTVKVLTLRTSDAAKDWVDNSWFSGDDSFQVINPQDPGAAAPSSTGTTTAAPAAYGSGWDAWGGESGADNDNQAECQMQVVARSNLTFCLSSVGICSFHQTQYDADAVRNPATGVEPQWGYAGATEQPSPVGGQYETATPSANNDWGSEHQSSQWSMATNMTYDAGEDFDNESPKCLQLYRYTGGCVLLTGIDDTSRNQRNNDYFDCNIALLIMNYRKCVQQHNKKVFGSTDVSGDVFSVTYGIGSAGTGTALEKSVELGKVLYMANTMRTDAASHLFETGGLDDMLVEQLEFKCACEYDLTQQVSAGILTASGSLGSSTQNEVTQNFDVCIVVLQKAANDAKDTLLKTIRPNFNYYREVEAGYLNSVKDNNPEAQEVLDSLALRTCAEDPNTYGNELPNVKNIAGKDYVLAVIQDERSLPPNTSFFTDARIMPSNHSNSGDNAGINWAAAPAPGTGLSNGNCTHDAGFAAGESFTHAVSVKNNSPAISRAQTTGDKEVQNKMLAIFAFELPATAWLGYSFNLYYVRTRRCSVSTADCRRCGSTNRARRLAADDKAGAQQPRTIALNFADPQQIIASDPLAQGTRMQNSHYLYDSAAAMALLTVIASQLF